MSTQQVDRLHDVTQLRFLYEQHHSWLRGWLRKRLGNTFEAADLAQDTFVSVMTISRANHEILAPRPFLATVARRLMAHYRRRKLLETSYLHMATFMRRLSVRASGARTPRF